MAELINFVLKSAGCDLQVTEDDVNDSDNVNGKVRDLQDEHQTVRPATFFLRKIKNKNIPLTRASAKHIRLPIDLSSEE